MQNTPYIVVLAGGIGSKFWPFSRNNFPKQFLDLLGTGRTLLQMTYDRFVKLSAADRFYVVTSHAYAHIVKEQLPELSEDQILREPLRRNTATCVAYASYVIQKKDPEARVIVTPSDHLILHEVAFQDTMRLALNEAEKDNQLITIGIKPNRPDTAYGYIQYIDSNDEVKKVKTFTEKPDVDLAKTFLESGDFVWNSGMFAWKNKSIIRAFGKYMPEVAEVFEEGESYYSTPQEEEFIRRAYSLVKNVTIDIGIMEKSENVFLILGDFGWSDLGSWMSIHQLKDRDGNNNVVDANAMLYDTTNSYIKVSPKKLVVVHGLDNYLINESENVLLICKLDAEKKFKEFVADAKNKGEGYT
ncbi:mannose-1-phosphate guanylyltransferase [Echinicola strongylocentroti]|uniref:mannose-1-phosphate guanylyltransferase n=1 Tax=Echinicola strongylocentroti TaxID=1795355 RepID=A0A2Z4IG60_9BACT|nr:mannose-1-phosphate guanylyltransferase [Echinicola strongylocentroti]AWW29954.1 mannose-1-phosphate guanylyltransferase [Echinicola strongylocentroti]